jgi:hypothetical protein
VYAPRIDPKSSLSRSVSGMAAQFSARNGRSRRELAFVDRARDELLARAALADDENGKLGRSDAPDEIADAAQGGGVAQQPVARAPRVRTRTHARRTAGDRRAGFHCHKTPRRGRRGESVGEHAVREGERGLRDERFEELEVFVAEERLRREAVEIDDPRAPIAAGEGNREDRAHAEPAHRDARAEPLVRGDVRGENALTTVQRAGEDAAAQLGGDRSRDARGVRKRRLAAGPRRPLPGGRAESRARRR